MEPVLAKPCHRQNLTSPGFVARPDGWELVNTLDQEKKGYIKLVVAIFKHPKKNLHFDENRIVPVRNSSKPGVSHQEAKVNI